jgi:hypothetical protein
MSVLAPALRRPAGDGHPAGRANSRPALPHLRRGFGGAVASGPRARPGDCRCFLGEQHTPPPREFRFCGLPTAFVAHHGCACSSYCRKHSRQAYWKAPAIFLPGLNLTLADLGGVSECIFHALPDMARNLYTVSARPGHERNLMRPYFTAYGCDRVAECHDRFWIPCGGSRLKLS